MKNEFVMPIIVLSLVCLFVSGALAVVNEFTLPVIQKAAIERAIQARMKIIPSADGFELLDINLQAAGIPKTITEIYRTTNNTGYIFMISVQGFEGEIKLICGIDNDGKIIKTATLAQTETKGIATPVFENPHESQYIGKDKNLDGIIGVTGATISSNAYRTGIRDALFAFEFVKFKNQENIRESIDE
jgi:electron transport complex protein RnfG